MTNDINSLVTILVLILGVMITLLVIVAMIYLMSKMKKNAQKEEQIQDIDHDDGKGKITLKEYSTDSIFNFMEFDKIEDNMIVQNNGDKYLMIVECQGINYDLMSSAEKVAVEEGFVQFLNTLTHPVQIYTQTRTINLENSIQAYKNKVKEIENNFEKQKLRYEQMQNSGRYTEEQLNKAYFELTKQRNLCEYGKDIVYSTERMSLNKNVLNKKYYIVIPYYPSDLGPNNFDKEEIKNLAFSELYTRAQSIIRTLSVCEVNGRVLSSLELVDLLYVAYNRDDSETYGVDTAIRAGFDELYSTAPDVLDKKMKILDDKIEKSAMEKANQKVAEVKSEKQKQIDEKEESIDELISNLAKMIIEDNTSILGPEVAQKAIQKIDDEKDNKGGTKDVQEKAKTRKRRTTKTA